MLDPFCIHFGYLGEVVEKTPQGTSKIHVLGPLGDPSGVPFSIKSGSFFNVRFHRLFYWFSAGFGVHFGRLLETKIQQKTTPERKRWFFENERLAYTRAQFWRVGGPNIRPKGVKKWIGKSAQFLIEKNIDNLPQKDLKRGPKWHQKASKKR